MVRRTTPRRAEGRRGGRAERQALRVKPYFCMFHHSPAGLGDDLTVDEIVRPRRMVRRTTPRKVSGVSRRWSERQALRVKPNFCMFHHSPAGLGDDLTVDENRAAAEDGPPHDPAEGGRAAWGEGGTTGAAGEALLLHVPSFSRRIGRRFDRRRNRAAAEDGPPHDAAEGFRGEQEVVGTTGATGEAQLLHVPSFSRRIERRFDRRRKSCGRGGWSAARPRGGRKGGVGGGRNDRRCG